MARSSSTPGSSRPSSRRKLGRENEAVTIDDAILSAQPPPEPELRFATLCLQGRQPRRARAARNRRSLRRRWPFTMRWPLCPRSRRPGATRRSTKRAALLNSWVANPQALTAYYDVLDRTVVRWARVLLVLQGGLSTRRASSSSRRTGKPPSACVSKNGEARRPTGRGSEVAAEPAPAGEVYLGLNEI